MFRNITAIATVILTFVLVLVTAFYAYVTWRMAKISHGQLKAALQPQLLAGLLDVRTTIGGVSLTVKLENVGTHFFKLQDVQVDCYCVRSADSTTGRIRLDNLTGDV